MDASFQSLDVCVYIRVQRDVRNGYIITMGADFRDRGDGAQVVQIGRRGIVDQEGLSGAGDGRAG